MSFDRGHVWFKQRRCDAATEQFGRRWRRTRNQCPKGWLAGLGLLTVVLLDVSSGKPATDGPASAVGGILFLGLFLSTLLANVLMQQQPRR